MKLRVSTESLILVMICLADMFATLFFVMHGCAVEQNPLMAACLRQSPMLFVLVKVVSFVPFVVAVEYYRRRNASFARLACRSAIALYLVTFVVLTVHTNLT
jgi:hypothetical protein